MHELKAKQNSIEGQMKKVLSNLDRNEREPIRIGVLGLPESGKSSLFAIWYLRRVVGRHEALDLVVSADGNDTGVYLSQISEALVEKGSTKATAAAPPEKICLKLKWGPDSWSVETMDYAGVFARPTPDKVQQELKKSLLDFLKKCDLILCLFDVDERSPLMPGSLDVCLPDDPPRMLIAVTKLDKLVASGELRRLPSLENISQLRSTFNAVFRHNSEIKPLCDYVRARFGQKGFLMSLCPLGGDFSHGGNGKRFRYPLNSTDFEPYEVHTPLRIALETKQKEKAELSNKRRSLECELGKVKAEISAMQRKIDAQVREARTKLRRIPTRDVISQRLPMDSEIKLLRESAQALDGQITETKNTLRLSGDVGEIEPSLSGEADEVLTRLCTKLKAAQQRIEALEQMRKTVVSLEEELSELAPDVEEYLNKEIDGPKRLFAGLLSPVYAKIGQLARIESVCEMHLANPKTLHWEARQRLSELRRECRTLSKQMDGRHDRFLVAVFLGIVLVIFGSIYLLYLFHDRLL